MNIIALTIDNERKSVERLGFPTHTWINDKADNYNNSIVLRFGNSHLPYDGSHKQVEFRNVVNSANSIKLNCCKAVASYKLSKVINTPKIYIRNIPANRRVILRPIYHQSGGADFQIVKYKKKTKISNGNYATQFIDSKKEWRVWFVRNGNKINVMGAIDFFI